MPPLPDDAAVDDGPDLRSTIESAIDADEGGGTEPSQPAESAPDSTPQPVEKPAGEPQIQAKGDRDSLGRFIPKGKEAPGAPGTAPGTPGATQQANGALPPIQPAPLAPALQAPASWSPGAREHWKTVPAAVQQEVARRESEMARYVNEMAPARNIAERFTQTIQPFLGTIQAEGVDPLTAVRNLMSVTQTLRSGTQYEKAQTLAQIVKVYGVDIQALDSALVGAEPPAGSQQQQNPQYVQQAVQQALAPLYQAAQNRQQQIAQAAEGEARSELETFAQDPANEFFQDLRHEMADIIELGERRGRDISIADAYRQAAMLHPEVSKVMLARQQGANARQLTQNAQRARSAAVSVRGSAPVGNPAGPEPSSIRESIEAAISAHSGYS
jgi:hypothetical protein